MRGLGTRANIVSSAAIVLLAAVAVTGVLLSLYWPFTQGRVTRSLAGMTGSRIRFQGPARLFFFPHPGLEAREVQIRRGADDAGTQGQRAPPLACVNALDPILRSLER